MFYNISSVFTPAHIKKHISAHLRLFNMQAFGMALERYGRQPDIVTENGRPAFSSVSKTSGEETAEEALLVAFNFLRGTSKGDVARCFDNMFEREHACDQNMQVEAFVLWAHNRAVRGGRGEKQLSLITYKELAKRFPKTAVHLAFLLPEFGSWKDVTLLMEDSDTIEELKVELVRLMRDQLVADQEAEKPSLAPKWAPSEGSKYQEAFKAMAYALYPSENPNYTYMMYRKTLSSLRKRLGVVEIKMCGNAWDEIEPGKVPGVCAMKKRKAFLNLDGKGEQRSCDEKRIKCADNFNKHIAECKAGKGRMHGGVLDPHEITNKIYVTKKSPEDDLLECQWANMKETLLNQIRETHERERQKAEEMADEDFGVEGASSATAEMSLEEEQKEEVQFAKMFPLVDVSPSMNGLPKEVAVALGIFISEISPIPDKFITFDKDPRLVSLSECKSLREKVHLTWNAPWGQSTDFTKALKLLLHVMCMACKDGTMSPSDFDDFALVVLSDMQFDESQDRACKWETQYEELQRMFKETGYSDSNGEPLSFKVPRVIFWNLRASNNVPVNSDTPNVDMVSGFSKNMLELFASGNLANAKPEVQQVINPLETMWKALRNPRYDVIREKCAELGLTSA